MPSKKIVDKLAKARVKLSKPDPEIDKKYVKPEEPDPDYEPIETAYHNAAIGKLEYDVTALQPPPKPLQVGRPKREYKDPEGVLAAREALANFDKLVERREMVQALRYKGDDASLDLADSLEDPKNDLVKLFTILKSARMRAADLIAAYRDYNLAAGLVAIARRTPKILDDVAADAESARMMCQSCDGTGALTTPDGAIIDCTGCFGRGWISKIGDKDARDLVWDALGIKKGGQSININMQQNTITPREAAQPMSSFIIDVDKLED